MNTETIEKPLILADMYETARRAHYWVSFDPEKRAKSIISDYSEELTEDLAAMPEEQRERYSLNYRRYLGCWLGAKSRCASSVITGGSGFDVRKAEKANDREHNHYTAFREWRERAMKAIERNERKKNPVNPLNEAREKLEGRKRNHELMKELNKVLKSLAAGKVSTEFYISEAEKHGLTEAQAIDLLKPDCFGIVGFARFSLTNNLAEIKRLEDRVKMLEAKEGQETKQIEFGNIKVVQNMELDRIQVFFPGKPRPEIISTMKGNGFKWAPSQNAWQRQLTGNAIAALNRILPTISK